MMKDIRQHRLGRPLLVGLALVLVSCRDSVPPPIEICIGDGFGGAKCIERDGSKLYRTPSELTNYWLTNQPDMQAFSSWCYDTSSKIMSKNLNEVKEEITKN